jgi:DNA modification methylase
LVLSESYIAEPIRNAFIPKKAQSWLYKIHPFYTRQPLNVVEEYVRHFCPVGGLVVDPFCGSGVTAVAALSNRRRALCIDLDPLAVFITKMTCIAPVDLDEYWQVFAKIEKTINPLVDFIKKASSKEIENYKLTEWFPVNYKLPSNSDRSYVDDLFGKSQLILLSHLVSAIKKVTNENVRELLFFAFSSSLDKMSLMYRAPEEGKKHGGGSGLFLVYRYWIPLNSGERDAWDVFRKCVLRVSKAKEISNSEIGKYLTEESKFKIFNDSAESLNKYTSEKSIDYIFTDPPYGAHISYLDLSTMWHAWFEYEVTEEMRNKEAIEGGEKHFDRKHYLNVLQGSFEQMFIALKDEAWLSLVYHHKDQNLWYDIRDMMKYIGFKYVNVVAQPLSNKSFHKVKQPLRVLGESLIINFQKTRKRVFQNPMSLPIVNVIKNVAERVIYKLGGATTEEILRDVVSDLFDNDLFFDAVSKKIGDILAILESDFELNEEGLWHIKPGRQLGNFIPPKLRIQYYLIGYLKKVKKANFDSIITVILPLLVNGHQPTKDDIAEVLHEIGISRDNVNWELKDPKGTVVQEEFQLDIVSDDADKDITFEIPESTTHNQHIYRLAILGIKAGFVPYIGKRERSDPMFRTLKYLKSLNIDVEPVDVKRIEQIDLIWADSKGKPIWAFEIEESTSILSALERYTSLLKAVPDIGKDRKLTLVVPRSRRKKLLQELTSSSYIGHPMFIENKVSYLYSDKLVELFGDRRAHKVFTSEYLFNVCEFPRVNGK